MTGALLPLYTAVVLSLDSSASPPAQHALGAATCGVLWLLSRGLSPLERRNLLACVLVSGVMELVLTLVWGLYSYRLGWVPLYVFAGHGVVYCAALRWAASPWRRLSIKAAGLAAAAALAASFAGGRLDAHGLFYLPILLLLLWRSPRRAEHAATFLYATGIELAGTFWGCWHWSPEVPGLGLPSGDPPSLVAGGYCLFAVLGRALARLRHNESRTKDLRVEVRKTPLPA